jgi:hypothetical protein
MRIALGIVGIFLSMVMMLQSCAITGVGGLTDDIEFGAAGALGVFAGFIFFVAAALSFSLPRAAGIVFLLSALLAVAGAQEFPDLSIWATLALIMGTFALISGYMAKKKKKGEQDG